PERLCRAETDAPHPALLGAGAQYSRGASGTGKSHPGMLQGLCATAFARHFKRVAVALPGRLGGLTRRLGDLIALRERLNDRFERDLRGTWLGCLSGRCVQRALRRAREISGRL